MSNINHVLVEFHLCFYGEKSQDNFKKKIHKINLEIQTKLNKDIK